MESSDLRQCKNVIKPFYQMVKDQPNRPFSLEREVQPKLLESLESDTENLALERLYQIQLRNWNCQNDKMVKTNTDGDSSGRHEEVDEEDDGEEEQQMEKADSIFDSLDVASHSIGNEEKIIGSNEIRETPQNKGKTMSRQPDMNDSYADLHYDPNWMNNQEGAKFWLLDEGSHDLPEVSEMPEETPWETNVHDGMGQGKNVSVVTCTSRMRDRHSESKAKLPTASSHPPWPQGPVIQSEAQTPEHQKPHTALTKVDGWISDGRSKATQGRRIQVDTDKDQANSHLPVRHLEKIHHRYTREYQLFYEQETLGTTKMPKRKQCTSYSRPKDTMKERQDLVERNKMTLGVRAPNQGSYRRTHGQKVDKVFSDQELETKEDTEEDTTSTSSEGCQEDVFDGEKSWQQRTQQLKVTQAFKEKKPKGSKGKHQSLRVKSQNSDASQAHGTNPKALGETAMSMETQQQLGWAEVLVRAKGDSSSALGTLHSSVLPTLRKLPYHSPLDEKAPTVNPLLDRRHPQTNVHLPLPRGPLRKAKPAVSHLHEVDFPFAPQLSKQGVPSARRMDQNRARIPTSDEQNLKSDLQSMLQYQESYTTCCDTTQSTGSYPVLPPIGKRAVSNTVLSSQSAGEQMNQRSSKGYLLQMEKQKQQKERAGYKAYTLKDYQTYEENLGGLGPNFEIQEEMAEKMRRQKEYSNLVREQNKKISRNPFLPTRNPVHSDKDVVPWKKALDYARSIPRPKVPSKKNKKRARKEEGTEHAQHLEDLGLSQLSTLEMLMKRHEEEKQAVAHFKVLHAI